MWLFFVVSSFAKNKWEGVPADVRVERSISAAPASIYNYLQDLERVKALFPEGCIGKWEPGVNTVGLGATAAVRYDFAALHRKLTITLAREEADRYVDFDHPGNKGFVIRFLLEPGADGTLVKLSSPLNPPPFPFRGYFYKAVREEWVSCYTGALEALEALAPTLSR